MKALVTYRCGLGNCHRQLGGIFLELEVPIGGWDAQLEQLGIRVTPDHLGRRSIPAVSARRLLQTRSRQGEKSAEDRARHSARLAAKHPIGAGVPAVEGMTPFESLVAAGGVVSPQDEFRQGYKRPQFLKEALAATERDQAEKKARAAEMRKQRLVDQAKDKLR